jgi:hypothetical protein
MLDCRSLTRVVSVALLVSSFPATAFCQARGPKPAANSMSEMPEVLVAPLFI